MDSLKQAIQLYNSGRYPESSSMFSDLGIKAKSVEEKKLYDALFKTAEAMDFVSVRDWERAKDFLLEAWRMLRELMSVKIIDTDSLKEEAYTAALHVERIIIGEAEEFDSFYTPKISVVR